MPDFIASQIRTVVPYIVGYLLTILEPLGVEIDTAGAAAFFTMLLGAVYYAVARTLENKAGAKWGWLLGYAKAPSYPPQG